MPAGFPGGRTQVRAVIADLFETHFGEAPPRDWLAAFEPTNTEKEELNRLRWVLAACHVLWHPSLRATPLPQSGLRKLLNQGLAELAAVVPSERIVDSEERREELVRRVLFALGLRLGEETAREAEDRLAQVNSVERRRIQREAAERAGRARAVQEENRTKAEAGTARTSSASKKENIGKGRPGGRRAARAARSSQPRVRGPARAARARTRRWNHAAGDRRARGPARGERFAGDPEGAAAASGRRPILRCGPAPRSSPIATDSVRADLEAAWDAIAMSRETSRRARRSWSRMTPTSRA